MPNTVKHASLENLSVFAREMKKKYAAKSDLSDLSSAIAANADSADVYTKAEIDSKVSSVYKPGGSVAFASLPAADEAHLGLVYNVTDKFTATADFVEGAGGRHPAGTNVVVVAVTDGESTSYKYDVLAGFVDLSGYVEKADFEAITEAEIVALFEETTTE